MTRSNPPGPLRKSAAFLGRVVVLLIVLVLVTTCDSGPPNQNHIPTPTPTPLIDLNQCSAHSSTPIKLNMYYGSEKEAWMEHAVNQFNALKRSACDGPITIKATPYGSGESMQKILHGDRPDIWSPAGRVWLSLLNAKWQQMPGHTDDLVATTSIDSPPLVISPVVIAMWQSRAQALGWPDRQIGWADIAALSTSPQGWAAYHQKWGMFKFAHTSPLTSNSGLDSVIAEFYAAFPNKTSGLSLQDVHNSQVQSFVAGIEHSIIHYGGTNTNLDSTGFFANTMCQQGQNVLDAAVLYESLVVEMNAGKLSSHCPEPVVAIYPKEGTLLSDHPFAIPLWVDAAHRTSALAFRNYLLGQAQQQDALQYGFRPVDLTIATPTPPPTPNGVDPTQPKNTLKLPTVDVVLAIQNIWVQLRHRVAVMLLLDTSGSMNYLVGGVPKITKATAGLKQFLRLLTDDDWAGLTTFSTEMHVLFPVAPLGSNRQPMFQAIDGIMAVGATRLYNSIADQVQALNDLTTGYIKALVVLTDGVDTVHQLSLTQLLQEITPKQVQVYTIAYGDSSYIDTDGLTQIAEKTGGQEYGSTPQDIQQVYDQISQSLSGL